MCLPMPRLWYWEAYFIDEEKGETHILESKVGHHLFAQAREAFFTLFNEGTFERELPECAKLADVVIALK